MRAARRSIDKMNPTVPSRSNRKEPPTPTVSSSQQQHQHQQPNVNHDYGGVPPTSPRGRFLQASPSNLSQEEIQANERLKSAENKISGLLQELEELKFFQEIDMDIPPPPTTERSSQDSQRFVVSAFSRTPRYHSDELSGTITTTASSSQGHGTRRSVSTTLTADNIQVRSNITRVGMPDDYTEIASIGR
jgi:hypothetical protein